MTVLLHDPAKTLTDGKVDFQRDPYNGLVPRPWTVSEPSVNSLQTCLWTVSETNHYEHMPIQIY